MKKLAFLTLCAVLALTLGCAGAEIIPPCEPGQQIGYPAAVLCESLTLREQPDAASRAVKTLAFGDIPIVVGADSENGPRMENGFVYCTLGDAVDSPVGWLRADFLAINPAWYVTEAETPVCAWNDAAALKVALLPAGTRLPILKEEAGWYLVSLRGAVGWIQGEEQGTGNR